MQELPVPQALQAFFLWVQGMMKYIPENTQIKALNMAKSTVCNVLSEVMVATAVPPGLEAGFAQPLMAVPMQPMEYRDTWVVQFMDKAEDEDSLNKGTLDEGRHLTLATPEDNYFLGLKYTEDQTEEMVMSPPRLLTP